MFAVALLLHDSSDSCRAVTLYQMWGAAFPQMLTCTISPHIALLISKQLVLSASLSFSVSHRKPNAETPGVLKSRKLVQRRRNTCPCPQDISRALQSPSSAPSASAASLDELIQRCLNSFGSSLSLRIRMCSQSLSRDFILHHDEVI